jgi:general secretion pathway protein M
LRAQADVQLLQMQALASEAAQLRAQPPIAQTDAAQALQAATAQLGSRAKLVVLADRATLTLNGATGEDLRQWLLQARSGARARPVEATLTRGGGNTYSGTLVVAIGADS